MLVVCIAAAIWQEPRLSPLAHSAMRDAADRAVGALESNDQVRAFFASLTGERSAARDVGLADKLSAALSR